MLYLPLTLMITLGSSLFVALVINPVFIASFMRVDGTRVIDNKKSYITLKSSLNASTNYEFEYLIPIKDAMELIKLSKYKITKTRYQIKINKKHWIVDIFGGSNFPLKIAEIELNHQNEEIQIPSWCAQEITGIKSLSNASLAMTPISKLSVKDRLK